MSDPLKTELGQEYYDYILKMALAAGMSAQEISKLARESAEEVVNLADKYHEEIDQLKVRQAIATKLFKEIATIKSVSLHMKLLDQLMVSAASGEMATKDMVPLFRFLDKKLSESIAPREDEDEDDLSDEEIRERARRLMVVK